MNHSLIMVPTFSHVFVVDFGSVHQSFLHTLHLIRVHVQWTLTVVRRELAWWKTFLRRQHLSSPSLFLLFHGGGRGSLNISDVECRTILRNFIGCIGADVVPLRGAHQFRSSSSRLALIVNNLLISDDQSDVTINDFFVIWRKEDSNSFDQYVKEQFKLSHERRWESMLFASSEFSLSDSISSAISNSLRAAIELTSSVAIEERSSEVYINIAFKSPDQETDSSSTVVSVLLRVLHRFNRWEIDVQPLVAS